MTKAQVKIFLYIFLVLCLSSVSQAIIITDKETYKIGDVVTINFFGVSENSEISILSLETNDVYRFLGLISDEIKFSPKYVGEYLINVQDGSKAESKRFIVEDIVQNELLQPQGTIIQLQKNEYNIGETVDISLNTQDSSLFVEIISPSNMYRFLGEPGENFKFIPEEPGNYEIRVLDFYGNLIEITDFNVIGIVNENQVVRNTFSKFKIKNSRNQLLNTEIKVYDGDDTFLKKLNSFDVDVLESKKYDIELNLSKSVDKIRFHNLNYKGDFDLGFEDLPDTSVTMVGKDTKKVYAIDPTRLEFDNATVTAVAQGRELYKCQEYNFTTQTCYGEYVKVMDLTPGEEYSFILTPLDPQYTEQTSSTIGCSCTNTCTCAPGATSQCTATCTDYCDIDFNIPTGAITAWLEKVHYDVTITIGGTGAAVSGSHEGRLDHDTTPNSADDISIGTSTVTSTTSLTFENNDMTDRGGANAFDDLDCSDWASGFCTWKPWLFSEYVCGGSRKSCTTTISLDLINYTWNYTADTTSPTIVLGNPENNSYSNTETNLFYYTPDDNSELQNCSIYINGGLNDTDTILTEGVETSFTINNMQDGLFSWYIMCYDTTLNSFTSGTKYLNVDTTIPSISFIDPTLPNGTHIQTTTIVINVSHIEDNPDTLTLNWSTTLQPRPYSETYTNITKTGLSDGTYLYYVIVNDSAGNINKTQDWYVTIDTQTPSVILNEPPHDNWINYNTGIVFNYTPTDTNLFNCSLYGDYEDSGIFEFNQSHENPISGSKNSFTSVDITDGIYIWNVLCYDESGRSSWATTNFTLLIDATPPVVNLLGPKNDTNWSDSNLVEFNYTVTDNYNVTSCTLEVVSNISVETFDDFSVSEGVLQNFTEVLANNKYNWTVYCTDEAGNTNTALPGYYNLSVEVGEDLVGPTINLNKPENANWTNEVDVALYYTPNDQSLIYNCSLYINDKINQTNYTVTNAIQNNFTINNMQDGVYNWYVNCTDNSSNYNEGKSIQTWYFTVDTTPPIPSLIYPEDNFNSSKDHVNFTWYLLDKLSENNYCDLKINNSVVASGVLTVNNTYANYTEYFTASGGYYWNLTCRDEIYNYNTTETWYLLLDFTAPELNLVKPLDYNLSLTGNYSFFFTPSENVTGFKQCDLYVNNTHNSSETIIYNNIQNNFTVTDFSSGNRTWYVTCTDYLDNVGTSDTWNFEVDVNLPQINTYLVQPEIVDLTETVGFNITVIDNVEVDTVIAQITKPSGSSLNYTMTWKVDDIYNLTYTDTTERGTYTVNIIANDTNGNFNISDNYYFFVKPGISIDKTYYDLEESVIIIGGGYDPFDKISFNVTDENNIMAVGFPANVTANSSGGFEYWWNITSSTTQLTGNHTIKAFDVFTPGQFGLSYAYLVRKPHSALMTHKLGTNVDVTGNVNESDDIRATLVAASAEDFIEFNWAPIVPDGQIISDIRFTLEHNENGNYNPLIYWFNNSNSQWVYVCTMVASVGTDKMDTCDLNGEVLRSVDANNLLIKMTDDTNYGASIGTWTNIDFAFVEIQFTSLSTDKTDYLQGENATIFGSNWPSSEELTINITQSSGLVNQEFTSTDVFGEFSKIYQVPYDGSLGQYNVTVFRTSNPEDTDTTYFNVHQRNSSIWTNKYYYGRTEILNIEGTGFSIAGNVSVLIYDAQNFLRINTTINASNLYDGNISYNWTIPYDYYGYYGYHDIIVKDVNYSNLNGTANVTIGVLVDDALKIQNAQYYDDTSKVLQSDDTSAYLSVYDVDEDQIRFEFLNASIDKYELSNLTFYIEHNESQNFDLTLEWYNGTVWVDVCTIAFNNNAESFDFCDILPYVQRSPNTRNLTLKITDNQVDFGVPGQNWTAIDYVYVTSWSESDNKNPNVTINLPQPDSIYNYSQGVLIQVDVRDTVELDTVFANVTWLTNEEIVVLNSVSVNRFGEGIYEAYFSTTIDLENYNITIFANDTTGNYNYTESTNFSIKSPDLWSNLTYMMFSNNEPIETENVTINLTIFNIGNYNSGSFDVQFFRGPYTESNQIGIDVPVPSLVIGENITVNMTWNAIVGNYTIYVLIDPPIITNGSVWEINETNNVVKKEIIIPSWQWYYGNATGLIKLSSSDEDTEYSWDIIQGGKVYAVETGTNVGWNSLQALGRDTIGGVQFEDFNESDYALGMENFTDSINSTFTINNQALFEKDITIYESVVSNIPFANSTNNSNFRTGILWDSSDLVINEYNGTQDLIFITEVQVLQQGKYGVYDYELKVPSTLDSYKIGAGTVSFYTEII